jgi:hypothetical protein
MKISFEMLKFDRKYLGEKSFELLSPEQNIESDRLDIVRKLQNIGAQNVKQM